MTVPESLKEIMFGMERGEIAVTKAIQLARTDKQKMLVIGFALDLVLKYLDMGTWDK